jgi:hypothetical protein
VPPAAGGAAGASPPRAGGAWGPCRPPSGGVPYAAVAGGAWCDGGADGGGRGTVGAMGVRWLVEWRLFLNGFAGAAVVLAAKNEERGSGEE